MRAGEARIDHRLVAEMPVVADIAGCVVVHQCGARSDRIAHAGNGWQVLQFDHQQFRGVLGLLAGFRDHHGDGVADMAHLADGQHRMDRFGHRRAVLIVDLPAARNAANFLGHQIGADEYPQHAGCNLGRGGIDRDDLRVRPVGALDSRVGLCRTIDVVDVVAAAVKKSLIFLAPNRCADALETHDAVLPIPGAAPAGLAAGVAY